MKVKYEDTREVKDMLAVEMTSAEFINILNSAEVPRTVYLTDKQVAYYNDCDGSEGAKSDGTWVKFSPWTGERLTKDLTVESLVVEYTVRSPEEIKKDYLETMKDDRMSEINGCCEFKNEEKRRALRKEYVGTLPKNKQLALWLHDKVCHMERTYSCSFHYESDDLEDDWSGREHKEYLEKANRILEISDDLTLIKSIIDIAEK